MADEKRERYINPYTDIVNAINTAKKEAKEEGRVEEKLSVAHNLKSMGLSDADIAKATGLTEEQIASL